MTDDLEPGEKAHTPRVLIVKTSDIARCPLGSLSAQHYYADEQGLIHCRCEEPAGVIR